MTIADLQIQGSDNGAFLLHLGAGHFVRGQDRNHFLDAVPGFQGLLGSVSFFADGGNHRTLRSDNDVTAQSQGLDALDDVIDLLLGTAGFHDDNHRSLVGFGVKKTALKPGGFQIAFPQILAIIQLATIYRNALTGNSAGNKMSPCS